VLDKIVAAPLRESKEPVDSRPKCPDLRQRLRKLSAKAHAAHEEADGTERETTVLAAGMSLLW
jgi:hypothetical protein